MFITRFEVVVVGWKAKCRLFKGTQSRFARLLIMHYSILLVINLSTRTATLLW